MFVISADEALELQLTSAIQEAEQPVKGIRYARHLWKEVMAGCSFERACEVARKYFESPLEADSLPLVVEKNSTFSLYLSDSTLKVCRAVHVSADGSPQTVFRGRVVPDAAPNAQRSKPAIMYRGRRVG